MKLWGPMTLTLALGMFSCSNKKDHDNDTSSDDTAQPLVQVDVQAQAQGQTRMEIDATSRTEWVGLDLDQGATIATTDFPAHTGWDLAIKRTTLKMGSGVVMQVVNQDFAAVTTAPQEGYIGDQPATEGAPETTGLAFHIEPSWYSYDINTHIVSSRGLVYVIKTNEGRYFKLKIHDYYNAARLPAYLNLEFQELKGVTP